MRRSLVISLLTLRIIKIYLPFQNTLYYLWNYVLKSLHLLSYVFLPIQTSGQNFPEMQLLFWLVVVKNNNVCFHLIF